MSENYQCETCEGCLYLYEDPDTRCILCIYAVAFMAAGFIHPEHMTGPRSESCEFFTPSLECRKVRALEAANRIKPIFVMPGEHWSREACEDFTELLRGPVKGEADG